MAEKDSYQTLNACEAENEAETNMEEGNWHGITQGSLTTPIAPEGSSNASAYTDSMNENGNRRVNTDNGIMLPIAPDNVPPAYSGWTAGMPDFGANLPAFPNFSGGAVTAWPGNNCSSCSETMGNWNFFPGAASYGQVRFIDASTNTIPVNFSIDSMTYASNFMFSHVSSYQQVSDGFHMVTVSRATGRQAVLLQQSFPFTANQKVTMVLVDAKEGGLNLIQIPDTGCNNLPSGYGCYRVVNVSYSDSNFDVKLGSGDTIFRNIGFTQASPYKRAMAGVYTVFITNSNFYSVIRELPVILIGAITGNNTVSSPLTSTNVNIQAGTQTTSYIMGNNWSGYSLRMITVRD